MDPPGIRWPPRSVRATQRHFEIDQRRRGELFAVQPVPVEVPVPAHVGRSLVGGLRNDGLDMSGKRPGRAALTRAAEWVVGAMTLDPQNPEWTRAPDDAALVAEHSVLHGVEGWVLHRSRAAGVELPGIEAAVHSAVARHQRTLAELGLVHAALAGAGLRFAVVKGPALVSQFYDGPRWRSSVDLDLLVRPRDVGRAVESLEAAGAAVLDANWPLLTRVGVHELVLQGQVGGVIDLHWSLGPRWGTAFTSPSARTLLARAGPIAIGGTEVFTLDWADTVVHLASHAAAAGGHRLLWCADLRAALAAAPVDSTPVLIDRAAEWLAGPALHLMLTRCAHALGIVPPAGLVEAVAPRGGWAGLVRGVEALFPFAAQAAGPSLPRIIARSARRDAAASWRALAGKSSIASLGRIGLGARPFQGQPDDPRSGYYPAGGPDERAAFLAGLEALDR